MTLRQTISVPQLLHLLFLSGCLLFLTPAPTLGAGIAEQVRRPAVKARFAVKSLLLDGTLAGQRIVAVGERGHILLSDDSGKRWRQANVPTQATLTAVVFPTPQHGWAVGHDLTVLHTKDGGENWTLQHEAPAEESPLLDVWFRDSQTGYAIGAYGKFLVTTNGGGSWSVKRISNDDFHLYGLAATAVGRLFIAGEAGSIYRSDASGSTWKKLASPYGGSYFGLLALENGHLLVFGLRGRVYRSADAGKTWARIQTNTEASLMGGRELPNGNVVIVGLGGTILRSVDNGQTFSLQTRPDRQALATVIPAGDGNLILLGEFGITRLKLPLDLAGLSKETLINSEFPRHRDVPPCSMAASH